MWSVVLPTVLKTEETYYCYVLVLLFMQEKKSSNQVVQNSGLKKLRFMKINDD